MQSTTAEHDQLVRNYLEDSHVRRADSKARYRKAPHRKHGEGLLALGVVGALMGAPSLLLDQCQPRCQKNCLHGAKEEDNADPGIKDL